MSSRGPIAVTIAAAMAVAVASAAPALDSPAAAATSPTGTGSTPAGSSVQLLKCSRGKASSDRWALFRGAMSQVPDGARMQMRFSLFERVGGSAHRRGIRAPGLGTWHEAQPGVAQFAYRQRIVALQAATTYQVEVAFRWYDAAGKRIAKQRRTAAACRQPGKLPNLFLRGGVVMRPGPTGDTARYGVRVGNNGNATARGVKVVLRVDGAEVDTLTVGRLRKGERRLLRFVGPLCKSQVGVELDPDDVVREISEGDNSSSGGCPALSPAA